MKTIITIGLIAISLTAFSQGTQCKDGENYITGEDVKTVALNKSLCDVNAITIWKNGVPTTYAVKMSVIENIEGNLDTRKANATSNRITNIAARNAALQARQDWINGCATPCIAPCVLSAKRDSCRKKYTP